MSKRGFGSTAFSKERQKAIASKGGKAAHDKGTAHRWSPEEASAMGKKGAVAKRAKRAAELERLNQEVRAALGPKVAP